MFIIKAPIAESIELENKIFLLKIYTPQVAQAIKPGEFLNVKVSDSIHPLLRRPFSVCDVEGDFIYLMFNILGEGTKMLSQKHPGDMIDMIGPLGHGFNIDGDYDTAIIVAGGLGAAPFPYLTKKIGNKKNIYTFVGGRTQKDVITYGMKNISISTDDGSIGFKAHVIDLLNHNIDLIKSNRVKIFGCGPTAMLRNLKEFCIQHKLEGEASTECAMACGFGICQGCPIQSSENENKYLLVCKDGPVFNLKDVKI